jgi:UDP-3-O-[3-hydroxymyristoyl] glucosamine N-acyltransferase
MSPRHDGPGLRLSDLAQRCGATLVGDGSVVVDRIEALDLAGAGAIAFLSNPLYRRQLAATRASAVILSPRDADATSLPKLVTANPYVVYARVAAILNPCVPPVPGIHASAVVASSARVAPSATVGAHVVIGERARIGERAQIQAGTVIGDDCGVGEDCTLHPRVVMYPRSEIGARAVVHSGVVIGADGFGMAKDGARWLKVPQLGRVIIGDDVEIGANTTIDRGAIGDTEIGDDVKLDNQIQIGHNCTIGDHTAIAGCVGVAGSTHIGRNCLIGGAAMIIGHVDIPDGTTISAATFVSGSIDKPGVYTGAFPILPHREWQHAASIVRRIRTLVNRVKALEKSVPEKGE